MSECDRINLPGNLRGDGSFFLIRQDKLICMLFIVHENPTQGSSHHTHAQACKYYLYTHSFQVFPDSIYSNMHTARVQRMTNLYILMDSLRHRLVYRLDAIAHGKLIHDVLMHLVKVNLPCIISLSHWDFDHAASLHIGREVEDVLQAKILNKIYQRR